MSRSDSVPGLRATSDPSHSLTVLFYRDTSNMTVKHRRQPEALQHIDTGTTEVNCDYRRATAGKARAAAAAVGSGNRKARDDRDGYDRRGLTVTVTFCSFHLSRRTRRPQMSLLNLTILQGRIVRVSRSTIIFNCRSESGLQQHRSKTHSVRPPLPGDSDHSIPSESTCWQTNQHWTCSSETEVPPVIALSHERGIRGRGRANGPGLWARS